MSGKVFELLALISKEEGIPMEKLEKYAFQKGYKRPSVWASKAAQDLAEANELGASDIVSLREDGRIGIDCVRNAIGEPSKKKGPTGFASPKAKELAWDNDLKASEFSDAERTGRVLKGTGRKSITLADVKAKMAAPKPKKAVRKTPAKKAQVTEELDEE